MSTNILYKLIISHSIILIKIIVNQILKEDILPITLASLLHYIQWCKFGVLIAKHNNIEYILSQFCNQIMQFIINRVFGVGIQIILYQIDTMILFPKNVSHLIFIMQSTIKESLLAYKQYQTMTTIHKQQSSIRNLFQDQRNGLWIYEIPAVIINAILFLQIGNIVQLWYQVSNQFIHIQILENRSEVIHIICQN
ncbi:unnamed protein product [Paramecium octaurelia]|uniref:Transmembrane protein n=1 Tax=Paramecium octaurelia TaxID=43137 RepID=A0A8S1V337_PAROT|nr:unnamed protein product [Paramecium octaurelia]